MRPSSIDVRKLRQLSESHTPNELASLFKTSAYHIRRIMRRNKIAWKKGTPGVRPRKCNVEKLLQTAETCMFTATELASMFGVHRTYVRTLCRDHGVSIPTDRGDPFKNCRNEYGDVVLDIPQEREPESLPEPTAAFPGTSEKVRVLAERVNRGEKLWHPDDQADYSVARWFAISAAS